LLLLLDGEAIGVIRIDINGNQAIFRRFAIREDLQRAGHGRVLLTLAESFAQEKGCLPKPRKNAPSIISILRDLDGDEFRIDPAKQGR
jgi:GNAT superfamily N-acetyltransferase